MNLPYGLMWCYCADCGAFLDLQLSAPKYDGEISHGLCRPCFAKAWSFPVVMLIPYVLLSMSFLTVVACA